MEQNREEKIIFLKNNTDEVEYYVIEQTRISGVNYLLVADSEEDDAEAMILKERSKDSESDSLYEELSEEEVQAVLPVFESLLDDVDFI